MSESRKVFEFLVLLCCILFENVSGVDVKLTRRENGDYFENPLKDSKFCLSTNAICYKYRPAHDECSYCKCKTNQATFYETHCVSFQDLQGGCRTYLSDDSVELLDLKKDGDTKLHTFSDEGLLSAEIISMNLMNVNFFEENTTTTFKRKKARWEVEIEWENVPKKKYGQVFKVEISYEVGDNKNRRNDCFVFKSKGSIMVTVPDLTTTTALPSETPLPSTIPLPSETPSHTIPPAIEDDTRTTPTIKPGSTNKARNEESSIEGNNAVTVFLTVVSCLLLLVVVVLVVLFLRRRSARTSKEKKNADSLQALALMRLRFYVSGLADNIL